MDEDELELRRKVTDLIERVRELENTIERLTEHIISVLAMSASTHPQAVALAKAIAEDM